MSSTDPVSVRLGAVAELELNRPDKQNAMTAEMGRALEAGVSQLNADPDVRVVLLRGAGRAFCAGGDFALFERNAKQPPEQTRRDMLAFYRSFLSVLDLRMPTVAVLHGAAVGAGLCLAAACDVRLAADEAKLGANFVRVGIHPGMGATVLLPRLVGSARAAELLLGGNLIRGERAAEIGLVNASVPRAELASLVEATTRDLLRAAPVAAAQTKATLWADVRRDLDAALEREAARQAIGFGTTDLLEAVAAFREGREPRFTGS